MFMIHNQLEMQNFADTTISLSHQEVLTIGMLGAITGLELKSRCSMESFDGGKM